MQRHILWKTLTNTCLTCRLEIFSIGSVLPDWNITKIHMGLDDYFWVLMLKFWSRILNSPLEPRAKVGTWLIWELARNYCLFCHRFCSLFFPQSSLLWFWVLLNQICVWDCPGPVHLLWWNNSSKPKIIPNFPSNSSKACCK